MDTALILLDAALVGGLAVWMTLAVSDNWRHPKMNEEAVRMVSQLDLLEQEFPEDFAQISYRRITDPRHVRLMFRTIRLAETVAAVALWGSVIALALAAFGAAPLDGATGAAVLATGFFSLIWGGFIIGGNYFAYWYCHAWAQSNHFMFMYWGLFVLVILLL